MTLQRSPLRRTAPDAPAYAAVKVPRSRKCRICFIRFTPAKDHIKFCGPECGYLLSQQEVAKAERATDRVRKVALKTRQDWLREAQVIFNQFIRQRDAAEPCISCGRFNNIKWNAGHFRSVGAQPALRFDETNVHKQCEHCNSYLSGNISGYRPRLIAKIGREAVELLEIEHAPAKYSIEDAQRIKEIYRAKLKALTNSRVSG